MCTAWMFPFSGIRWTPMLAFFLSSKRNDANFTNHEVVSWIEEGARVRRVVSGQVVSQESKGSRPAFQQQTSSRELGSGWSPEKQQLEEGQHAEVCLTLSSTAGSNYIYLTCFTLRSNQQQGQEANFKLVVEYISCHLCFKFVIIHLFFLKKKKLK